MKIRGRLVWKLSVVVLGIVCVIILGSGYFGNLLSRQYALDAVRSIMHSNSASIVNRIDHLLMRHNNEATLEFLEDMTHRNTALQNINLVSHPFGQIITPQLQFTGTKLDRNDYSCTMCHVTDDLPAEIQDSSDRVLDGSDGSRVVQVITPILNKPSCRTAACHQHAEAGPVLGILRTEYSLSSFDDLMKDLHLLLALAATLAVCLSFGTLLMMFRRFLANPLRQLVTGISTFADGDLGFRFSSVRNDEIGLVEDSFNVLADQIQSHQTELRRAKDYLESIVENTADLVITVNTSGFIQTFNHGAELALGYKRSEVIGQRIEILFDNPQERDTAIARLQEQDSVTNWETRFKTKSGQIRNVLLTISRLRTRRGELLGTLGISKDITIEKDLQNQLIQSEKDAAIGRAVTHIQHAIKNMLNTLQGGLYVVRVGHKKNQQKRIVEGCEMIEEGLSRISDLSLNLLKYAREWRVEPEAVDLTSIIEKIIVAVSQTARERGISIRTEIDDTLPNVHLDPRLIHMGLMDLVSNALDACELKDYEEWEHPEIVICVYRKLDGKSIVISIADNGIGMTPEIRDNVFTPFFSTKKKWGTGLGLALTSRIIGLHEGTIAVESELEMGAIFLITLPIEGPGQTLGGGR